MKIKKKALSTLIILVIALIAFGSAWYLGFVRTKIVSFSNLRDKYNMYE